MDMGKKEAAAGSAERGGGFRSIADIRRLTDHAIQGVLKEVEKQDLAVALQGASDAVQKAVFLNMSERAEHTLREDMEYMGPVKKADVTRARRRIVQVMNGVCDEDGRRRPARPGPAREALERLSTETLQWLADKPVSARDSRELVDLLVQLAGIARSGGIPELESCVERMDDPFLVLGLQLAVDGVDPALLREILQSRKKALLHELERRLDVAIAGVDSIQRGHTPRIVEQRCGKHFVPNA
jgi:hypothetical protein